MSIEKTTRLDGTLASLATYRSSGHENPLKKTTVTMYTHHVDAATDTKRTGFDPRLEDGKAFSLGPGPKVIGGQLRYAYDDRPGSKASMGRTQDFADILKEYKAGRGDAQSNGASGVGSRTGSAEGRLFTSAVRPPQKGRRSQRQQQQHQVESQAGPVTLTTATWASPHLTSDDLPGAPQLAMRETKGAPNMHIVASKHVFIPPHPQVGGDVSGSSPGIPTARGTGPWGRHTLGTINEYAGYKFIGHKDYERTCRALDGVGAWQRTMQDFQSSMHTGRPSHVLSPTEHMSSTLNTLHTLRATALGSQLLPPV